MNDTLAEFNGDIKHTNALNLEHIYNVIRTICLWVITRIFDCKKEAKHHFLTLQSNLLKMKSWGIILNKVSKANDQSRNDEILKDYLQTHFAEENSKSDKYDDSDSMSLDDENGEKKASRKRLKKAKKNKVLGG